MHSRLDEPSFDLATIYRHHHRLVRWVVRGAGVPEHAVDDVTQDVFVTIYRRRAQAPDSELRRWVVGVTRSVCHSYRRGSARRRHRLARTIEPEPSPPPDELLDGRTALRRLRGVLEGLTEPQRDVFVMIELEGLSAPEAAEALGANLSTVYSRLRLARQRVWAELTPASEVVASARKAGRPDRAQAQRCWMLVTARLDLEGSMVPISTVADAAMGKVGGLALGACLGVAMLGGIALVRSSMRHTRDSTAVAVEGTRTADPPALPAAIVEAEVSLADMPAPATVAVDRAAPPSVRKASPDPRAPRKTPASTLADEAELLRRAAKGLDVADLDETARLLDAHAKRFVDGVLADERRRLLAELERRRSGAAGAPTSR